MSGTVNSMTRVRRAQLRQASAKGVETRQQRKALHELVKAGDVDAYELLKGTVERWEPVMENMKASPALRMVPGIGGPRASRIMVGMSLSPETRLGKMSYERRAELADMARQVVERVL